MPMQGNVHPSLLLRKIIHFDMDAFYAAIEMRDDPSLRGRPIVVGGPPNSRSVVSTANYEARKYGVRSAMACSHAARLCKDLVFVPPNFSKYREASLKIREIFRKYTTTIEPLSLDEAYLDVTNNPAGMYAVKIAKLIQEEVYDTLQLTGSAGIAPNKLLAKIASDFRKPHGLTVVLPHQAEDFMRPLPLRKIHGIGPVAERKLAEVGLRTCHDVCSLSLQELTARVGGDAEWLYQRCHGIDERPVEARSVRKSIGREETFAQDILAVAQLHSELEKIANTLETDLRTRNLRGKTITLKVRYADFQRITRSLTLPSAVRETDTLVRVGVQLLTNTEAGQRKIRLLGLSVTNLDQQ